MLKNKIIKFRKKIKLFTYRTILRLKNIKDQNTLVIFSEQRNGSTWLLELLSKSIKNSLINWEPLQEDNRLTPKEFNFSWKPILDETCQNKEINNFFIELHRFKFMNSWTVSQNNYKAILKGNFIITKYVKANLLVPYLLKNINFPNKPIFLIRHPIDTCISQIIHFSRNDETLKNVSEVNIFIEKYCPEVELLNTNQNYNQLELQIINWFMNNYYTIKRLDNLNVHVVYYSDLLLDPLNEVKGILKNIGSKHAKNLNLQSDQIRRPSFTVNRKNFKKDPNKQLMKNFNNLSKFEKENIQAIFDHFKFTLYNAYSPYPLKEMKPELK